MPSQNGFADTVNPEVVTGDALPMHQQRGPQFRISPHMITFAAGVGTALLIMYLCTQFGKKNRD